MTVAAAEHVCILFLITNFVWWDDLNVHHHIFVKSISDLLIKVT